MSLFLHSARQITTPFPVLVPCLTCFYFYEYNGRVFGQIKDANARFSKFAWLDLRSKCHAGFKNAGVRMLTPLPCVQTGFKNAGVRMLTPLPCVQTGFKNVGVCAANPATLCANRF